MQMIFNKFAIKSLKQSNTILRLYRTKMMNYLYGQLHLEQVQVTLSVSLGPIKSTAQS